VRHIVDTLKRLQAESGKYGKHGGEGKSGLGIIRNATCTRTEEVGREEEKEVM